MSVIAGELVHIVKCKPVQVKYRKTQEFYLEQNSKVAPKSSTYNANNN